MWFKKGYANQVAREDIEQRISKNAQDMSGFDMIVEDVKKMVLDRFNQNVFYGKYELPAPEGGWESVFSYDFELIDHPTVGHAWYRFYPLVLQRNDIEYDPSLEGDLSEMMEELKEKYLVEHKPL